MNTECECDYIYSGEYYACNPPKYFGICKKCGDIKLHFGKPIDVIFNRDAFNQIMKKYEYNIT